MSLNDSRNFFMLVSVPRASGDEPKRLIQLAWVNTCSPRERG